VARLRQIIEEIERGELDVDVLSAKVREAGRLIQLCKDKLLKADEEVKKILDELDQ
jgi:exonuclease VII small subunit